MDQAMEHAEETSPQAASAVAAERPPRPHAGPALARLARAAAATAGTARRVARPTLRASLFAAVELVVVGVLAALPALFFWRILAGDPGDAATFPTGDFTDLHYPYRRFVSDILAQGQVPFWNPYVSAGHPSVGDIQFASLYPIGRLFALLGGAGMPFLTLEQQAIFHFSLAGVFTYLLGRRLLKSRSGAIVAALTFTYGGYLTGFPVQQLIILQVSVWLPLVLLFLDLAISYRSPALAIPAGLAVTMAALAGHPQTLFYVLLGAALYFAYRSWDRGLHITQPIIGIVCLGVGLGLAAPQLIPAYQHLQMTSRDAVNYPFTTYGFSLRELFGALVPFRFGGQALYQGILPLALVGVALVHKTERRAKVFWLLLAIVALLFSFGGNTFLQSLLYLGLPPLKFRDHERLALLVSLAVAMLAGYGVDALLSRAVERASLRRYLKWLGAAFAFICGLGALFLYGAVTGYPEVRGVFDQLIDRTFLTALLFALSIALLALGLRGKVSRAWPVLAIALVFADLFSTNWQQNLVQTPPDKLYPTSATVAYLRTQAFGLFRISSEGLLPGDGNAGSGYRLQDIVGNSPLEMESYQLFDKSVNEWQRWRLLNVRFLITKRDFSQDGRFRLVTKEGDVGTYEIKPEYRLPRAWIVHQTVFAGSAADAIRLVDGIDPAATAVVQDERVSVDPSVQPSGGLEPEVASVVEYEPNRLSINAQAARPGLLVVSEVYHPDWTAKVDGVPAQVLKVDGVLRGILLPAGQHQVEMTFESKGFALGLDIVTKVELGAGALVAAELLLRLLLLALPPLYRLARRTLRRPVAGSPA